MQVPLHAYSTDHTTCELLTLGTNEKEVVGWAGGFEGKRGWKSFYCGYE